MDEEQRIRIVFKRNVERLMRDAALLLIHNHYAGCAASSIQAMEQAAECFHQVLGLSHPETKAALEADFRNRQHQRRLMQGMMLALDGMPAGFGVDQYVIAKAGANALQIHKEMATYVDRDETDPTKWREPEVAITEAMAKGFFETGRLCLRAFGDDRFDSELLRQAFRPFKDLLTKVAADAKAKRPPPKPKPKPAKMPKAKR